MYILVIYSHFISRKIALKRILNADGKKKV